MDWSTLTLQHQAYLGLAPAAVTLCAVLLFFGSRHGMAMRWAAFGLRMLAIAVVVFLLAVPMTTEETTRRFEPAGTWRLLLSGATAPGDATDYCEEPETFVARVRQALDGEHPPARCEVYGDGESARWAQRWITALGVPCSLFQSTASSTQVSTLVSMDAPRALQPGEPLSFSLKVSGAGEVNVSVDGKPAESRRDGDKVSHAGLALPSGRHVIEAVLLDAGGTVTQRIGQVLRVSEKPKLLLLGLDDARAAEATALAPNFDAMRCAIRDFSSERLHNVQVVLATLDALDALKTTQAFALSSFVGRGGGLYTTGDGAKQVAPDYLPAEVKKLLPVTLLPEAKADQPDTPPVEDRPVVTEIAKVSVCFVIDRSGSMDAQVGNQGVTRWQVAVKGVSESLSKLLTVEARASVMTFTLEQKWQAKPGIFLAHNRAQMITTLDRLQADQKYDEAFYNTDIYAAVKAAIAVMEKEPSAVKLIIMLTDGADRPANSAAGLKHSDLSDLAVSKNINIVAIGIGEAFGGEGPESAGARKVIRELATKPGFAFMPSSDEDAAKAHVIFVNSVETAFQTFDDKKKREEEDRQRKLKELADKMKEPPKVDMLKGIFALTLSPMGSELFGAAVLPQPAPKVQWYARHIPKAEAAIALGLATDDAQAPAALAFGAYSLGRVAFWSAGTDVQSLGEVAGWAKFPALFAASLRWLTPRDVPDLRLVAEATPEGIRLTDPIEEAVCFLSRDGKTLACTLRDDVLIGEGGPIPEGAWIVLEQLGGQTRELGDTYVAAVPPDSSRFEPVITPPGQSALQVREPSVSTKIRVAEMPILYLVALLLIVLPLERLVRRRS